jgi:hypothetical protein
VLAQTLRHFAAIHAGLADVQQAYLRLEQRFLPQRLGCADRELTRAIRAAFIETARFERFLMRPGLRYLCRADFIPNLSPAA